MVTHTSTLLARGLEWQVIGVNTPKNRLVSSATFRDRPTTATFVFLFIMEKSCFYHHRWLRFIMLMNTHWKGGWKISLEMISLFASNFTMIFEWEVLNYILFSHFFLLYISIYSSVVENCSISFFSVKLNGGWSKQSHSTKYTFCNEALFINLLFKRIWINNERFYKYKLSTWKFQNYETKHFL